MTADPPDYADAERLDDAGDFPAAADSYAAALASRLAAGVRLGLGDQVAVERLADLAGMLGRHAATAHLLAGLAEHNRDRPALADYFTLKLADALVAAPDLPAARAALESLEARTGPLTDLPAEPTAYPAWEAGVRWAARTPADRPVLFARLYLAAGGWLAGHGFFRHAAAAFAAGERHAVAPDAPALAAAAGVRLSLGQAAALIGYGDLPAAGAVLAALAARIDPARHPGWHVERCTRLAQIALLTGHYGDGLRHLKDVADACRAGGFREAAAAAAVDRGRALVALNQVLAAEDALTEAEGLSQEPALLARAAWVRELAADRGASHLADRAGPPVARLWGREPDAADAPPGPDPLRLPAATDYLAFFDDRCLAVRWRLARGRVAEADGLFAELRRTFAPADSLLVRLRLEALTGLVSYAAGDRESAGRRFAALAPHLEAAGLRPELRDAVRVMWWCAARADALDAGVLAARLSGLTEELAGTLPPVERAVWRLDKWDDAQRGQAGRLVDLEAESEALAGAGWLRGWPARRRLRHRIDGHLAALDSVRAELAGAGTRGRPDLAVGADEAVLVFQVLPEFTGVVRLTRGGGGAVRRVPLTLNQARYWVARWHRPVARWYRGEDPDPADADPATAAAELAAALGLDGLLADLPARVRRLVLVADDALHGFPFAALPLGGGLLVERFALSYRADALPRRRRAGQVRAAAVVAVPHGAPPTPEFPAGVPPLPQTRAERREVAKWLRRRGVAVNPPGVSADPAEVLASWGRAGYVHFAGHGLFEPDRPDRSGLVLVDRAARAATLTLRDVLAADLSGVEHVTLSNCWGADSFALPGRHILSLPEALTRAGAGGVLAALWPIADDVGRHFAARFLHHLGRGRRDDAVRLAQLDLLRGPHPHPFDWAGYKVFGGGPIRWVR